MRNILFFSFLLFLFSCGRDNTASRDHPEYFDTVFRKADIILSKDVPQVTIFLDSVYNAFPAPGIMDLYRKYDYLSDFGNEATRKLTYIDSMIWVIRDHVNDPGFTVLYGKALLKKGNVLLLKRDFEHAFAYIYLGRQVIGNTRDTCELSRYTFMLGTISFMQGKYLDAADNIKQGLVELASCPKTYKTFKLTQARLDDVGVCYSRCGQPDSAMRYYDSAMHYLTIYADSFPEIADSRIYIETATAVVCGNKGDVYAQRGDTLEAERMYRISAWTNGRKGCDHGDAQCSQLKLVNLCLAQHRVNEANDLLLQIRSSLDSFPNREWELKWYRLKMEYLHTTERSEDIYGLMLPYIFIRDSFAKAIKVPSQNVEEEYGRRFKLAELQKKNEIKTAFLIGAVVIFLFVAVIAFLLWVNWKRGKKLNDRISRQNKEMQLAMQALSESQEENTRMMQIVAHDLKNPIASMTSVTTILLDNPALSEDDKKMLELMRETTEHSLELIADLLNVNTTAEGTRKAAVEVHLLLRYCVDLLQFKAAEKGQTITLDAEAAILNIDREKIWRVISNLIVNAIKFSPQGGVIQVKAAWQPNEFRITVQDHGLGIPEKHKDRIFDMFTIAKRTGTAGEASSGLGLAISRRIVEAHGGRIWFDSKEGIGTTFYVALPV